MPVQDHIIPTPDTEEEYEKAKKEAEAKIKNLQEKEDRLKREYSKLTSEYKKEAHNLNESRKEIVRKIKSINTALHRDQRENLGTRKKASQERRAIQKDLATLPRRFKSHRSYRIKKTTEEVRKMPAAVKIGFMENWAKGGDEPENQN